MSEIEKRCEQIQLILSDVDGVLTDGAVSYDNQGIESKRFHIRDGLGIRLWQKAGHKFGIVTGRSSQIVRMRASELDVTIIRQGVSGKWDAVHEIMLSCKLEKHQVCFIGDDLPDLSAVRQVGFGVTVADASEELRENAHYVTERRGGCGAVREVIEMILKHQRRWDSVVQRFLV